SPASEMPDLFDLEMPSSEPVLPAKSAERQPSLEPISLEMPAIDVPEAAPPTARESLMGLPMLVDEEGKEAPSHDLHEDDEEDAGARQQPGLRSAHAGRVADADVERTDRHADAAAGATCVHRDGGTVRRIAAGDGRRRARRQ